MRIDRVAFAAALARADINAKQLAELSGVSRVTITAVIISGEKDRKMMWSMVK
ncbi:MAG: hypothetical protein J1F18_15755 [Lachnospiraceae bacterium]|nr:hypothetical protein [Lachnospiraceae bacterium]